MDIKRKLRLFILLCLLTAISSFVYSQDTERPLSPQLVSVSVAENNTTRLQWNLSQSADVEAYIIYLYNDGYGVAIDTVRNPKASTYNHKNNFASKYSVEYVLAAIDYAKNISPLSNSLSTIYIEASLDTCNHEIDLTWNLYKNDPFEVLSYDIFLKADDLMPIKLATLGADETNHSYSNFETTKTYCFTIKANIEGKLISESNLSCINTNIPRPPNWINGDYSTTNNNSVVLSFSFDPSAEIKNFIIEKASSPKGPFELLKEYSASKTQFTINDDVSDNIVQYYRVSSINSCNVSVRVSNIITSMLINTSLINDEIVITWPEYKSFAGTLSEYNIYRVNNNTEEMISTITNGDIVYKDHLKNFSYSLSDSKICYFVGARESGNPNTSNYTSKSNSNCIEIPLNIFVPNAFTPNDDQVNDHFYPVLSFVPSSYKLVVASLAGSKIFETKNYLTHWDGRYNGKKMKPDTYVWFLEARSADGRQIVKSGTVNIIFN